MTEVIWEGIESGCAGVRIDGLYWELAQKSIECHLRADLDCLQEGLRALNDAPSPKRRDPNRKSLVYIAHACGTGDERDVNRALAAKWVKWAALTQGVSPVATWIVMTGELDEKHRDLGLECDFAAIARCDELWLCGERLSPGMIAERDYALSIGVTVVDMIGKRLP